MPADKDWVLLAEYCDKSLLRSTYAFEFAKLMGMPWTPRGYHVEVFLNGSYNGTYFLGEHVKVASDRVNITDDGYLIENDNYYSSEPIWFTTSKGLNYTFKHPDTDDMVKGDDNYNFILNYMNQFESVLYSSNFKDPVNGYRKYLDVESFIKYYIVHEIAKNVDGNFRGSCHMALRENGKIELPMIWDFDIAFGNADHITWEQGASSREWDGWYIKTQSPWFDQLFKDPAFVAEVKTMWNELKPQLDEVPEYVRAQAKLINEAQIRNFSPKPQGAGWSVTERTWNTSFVRGSYQAELNYLVYFIEKRIEWLHTNINNLD